MRNLILYFFLLVLKISLNFCPDIGYKRGRFSKTLIEKNLEFFPHKGGGLVALYLSFVLLSAKVDPIVEVWDYKKYILKACDIGRVKIVIALLTEIVTLHMRATIIQVEVPALEGPIPGF